MTAEQFKAIRTKLGLSQHQLAWVLDMRADHVSRMERGVRDVPPLLDRLMRAYAAGYRPGDWPLSTSKAS